MVLSLIIIGADTELGQETTRQLIAAWNQVTGLAQGQNGATVIQSNGGLPAAASLTNASALRNVF